MLLLFRHGYIVQRGLFLWGFAVVLYQFCHALELNDDIVPSQAWDAFDEFDL